MRNPQLRHRNSYRCAIAILVAPALTLVTLSLGVAEATTIAPIVNGRFETGDLSGWNVSIPLGQSQFAPLRRPAGTVHVESSDFLSVPTPPQEGNNFLAIGTAETGDVRFPENRVDITASQSLKLDSNDILSGWSSFYNGDYIPQDSAWVRILDSSGREIDTPWYESSGTTPLAPVDFLSVTPWSRWQWTAPAADTYTLVLGATALGDNTFASYGLHDSIKISHVPESSSAWLFALTLTGVALLARKSTQLPL